MIYGGLIVRKRLSLEIHFYLKTLIRYRDIILGRCCVYRLAKKSKFPRGI